MNVKLNFTGKLGVRTKYQTFKTPQLIAEISENPFSEELPSVENIIKENSKVPQDLDLDPETILLNLPACDDNEIPAEFSIHA